MTTDSARLSVLDTEPGRLSTRARRALDSIGAVHHVEADRPYLLAEVGAYDVLFIGLKNAIDRAILDRAERLKCIVTPTTGTDHIDVHRARERGITVLSLAGETEFLGTITATAELTWGLLLSLIRNIARAHASVLEGHWNRDDFRGIELRGKTLGIVGYGRLGRMVAGYGAAFHMRVIACDHKRRSPVSGVEFVTLEELLRAADVVSVHLPLSPDTEHFFNARRFAQMKEGAIFVNTARGRIVEERALLQALREGKLAGAAVDVLAEETSTRADWLAGNELRRFAREHGNLLITPHIGGVTVESTEKTNLFMIEKLARHLALAAPDLYAKQP